MPFDAEMVMHWQHRMRWARSSIRTAAVSARFPQRLYVAVLKAELEVTERYSHSMIVHYVDPSMDAAIAEGLKDLKFINNTDAPIYIEASADGSTLHFAIYGHETRDPNRTVRYESETTNTEDPTPSLTEDANASFGTIEQTSYGYQGSTARLWKIVNDNGNETKGAGEFQHLPHDIGCLYRGNKDGQCSGACGNAGGDCGK